MEIQNWKKMLIPYTQAVDELKIKFKAIRKECKTLDEYSPIEFVTGRVKNISSILEKAKKKHIPLSQIEDKIDDIAGIRIMCQFVEDIYRVINIIRARDGKDMTIVEERNYIENTKASGYRSYHVIIKYPVQTAMGERLIFAEIQIRTLAMNFWATIEHSLRYKYRQNMPTELQDRLIKAAQAAYLLDQEMSAIRDEVLKAQTNLPEESHLVGDILANIQTLFKQQITRELQATQDKFWELWESSNMEELELFNEELVSKILK
ncbi:MAG: GTP pyrophosphokinase [Candidatus Epulonipiscium fishelsonii]|nr:MAG: GTP pyrophosphokinase [Epulopiscium sp. AS2M-Bin002]